MKNLPATNHQSVYHDVCKQDIASLIFNAIMQLRTKPDMPPWDQSAADLAMLLEKPPESKLGDYSFPCFRYAKMLGLAPPQIAQHLANALAQSNNPWIKRTAVVNAFCNIFIDHRKMAQQFMSKIANGEYFSAAFEVPSPPQKVMIEYSQPNTHKEFHVGHMRNVCLGSAMVKIYRYCGYPVIAANYFGDEGTHIAKCLWMLKKKNTAPTGDRGAFLGSIYQEASRTLESLSEEELTQANKDISSILAGIEQKKEPYYSLWKETRQWSLDAFHQIYEWIGAEFDREFFESEVSTQSQSIVDEYLQKGVFVQDQGAIGCDLSQDKLGFMIARKRDGNTLYATKDLALAKRKFEEFKIDKSIYVVADEQNHHFKQVFKTLEKMGFPQASQCYHLTYGLVMLPEGKMSSRAGTTIPFLVLKDRLIAALGAYLEKYKGQWSQAEIDETAKRLSVGAIKYGMLQADPVREIVFDMDQWLSFEGNTGPYLMYAFSRAQSIFAKAKEESIAVPPLNSLDILTDKLSTMQLAESEEEMIRLIFDFNGVVLNACHRHRPNEICHHLFALAKAFSRFYADVSILKESDTTLRGFRLSLVDSFQKTLQQGLNLLGITPPQRM
jgi:arginyl-tRNA synthetase